MHNVRTREGRAALDSDILHHLQSSTQKEPLSVSDLTAKLGGDYSTIQIRQRLKGLIDAGKVGRHGLAVATRYYVKAKGKAK